MAQFILVVNNLPNEKYEQALEIRSRIGDSKVKFVPEAVLSANPQLNGSVTSIGMRPVSNDAWNGIRFEWGDDGAEFGVEIMRLFHDERDSEHK